ncbi:CaiB/BaiF CoA transferase family protein [Amycolatopsis methanolica]|uniref:L-carnitine dehydratase/bile acid-inducible protein F n=1 Tax=Amycolatopsis methanolica 239 TaxID=1068978 RepID=A0A076N442_AMYME|nr:CoA transferase [Amycolatopsis methanolica]AIJ24722.1 L-carnitine dehydratase/bile acid-inducible protein F [Amycolatopsis methanolica 239]
MTTGLPLEGVRVADFTWVGAGPFLTKPLADHGADVIKIESRTRTDPIRSMAPFRDGRPGVDRSGYFANRNSSKRSICLDLKHPAGRRIALDLIVRSDVVANNFTPGTMKRLGLDYETVRAIRPDIIYLEMPMQGTEGPYRDFRGYGLTIAAAGGLLGLSGYRDRPPVGTGTNYPDHVPNPLHAAVAVLAALRNRRRTGRGEYIELAQLESTVNAIGPAIVAGAAGAHPERSGNDDPVAAPHGVYPCSGDDTWCAIGVFDDAQWHALVAVLNAPPWAALGDLAQALDRRERRRELDELIAAETKAWDADDLATALTSAGVPAAPVRDADGVLNHDPQLAAREHWVWLDHPVMGPSVYDGIPYRMSRTSGRLRAPAPLLGADSHDVCTRLLGMDDKTYSELAREGVVG